MKQIKTGAFDPETNTFVEGRGLTPHADCICKLLGFEDVSDFNMYVFDRSRKEGVEESVIFEEYDQIVKRKGIILIGSNITAERSYKRYVILR